MAYVECFAKSCEYNKKEKCKKGKITIRFTRWAGEEPACGEYVEKPTGLTFHTLKENENG